MECMFRAGIARRQPRRKVCRVMFDLRKGFTILFPSNLHIYYLIYITLLLLVPQVSEILIVVFLSSVSHNY